MLNRSVVKLLKSGMWDLATCADGKPNVVPVAFKEDVTEDGKLCCGDVSWSSKRKGALIITPSKVIVTTLARRIRKSFANKFHRNFKNKLPSSYNETK